MFFYTLFFLPLSLFIFQNSMYFTFSLLVYVLFSLSYMCFNYYLTSLSVFLLLLVYGGAMLILIGYICAVTPNLYLEPNYSLKHFFMFVVLLFMAFLFFKLNTGGMSESSALSLSDFFYTYQGLFYFIVVLLMLFITLLMVTSQYAVPCGPFRALKLTL